MLVMRHLPSVYIVEVSTHSSMTIPMSATKELADMAYFNNTAMNIAYDGLEANIASTKVADMASTTILQRIMCTNIDDQYCNTLA